MIKLLVVGIISALAAVAVFPSKPIASSVPVVQNQALPISPVAPVVSASKSDIKSMVLGSNTVYLVGVVGKESANRVIREIKRLSLTNKNITLVIDSPGGSVFDGARIISTMEGSKVNIDTVCIDICASMGFIIHQYGNKRMMLDRAILMSHPAFGGINQGQINNMMSLLRMITRFVDKMDAHISVRAGLTLTEYKNLIAHELWLDAEDATSRKFNDEIVFIQNDLEVSVPDTFLGNRIRQFRR